MRRNSKKRKGEVSRGFRPEVMASREEILANFQACTGIENVEVAISKLEDAEWSFVDAVNKAIPSPDQQPSFSTSTTVNTSSSSPEILSTPPLQPIRSGVVSLAEDFLPGPSSTRMLEFDVQHQNNIVHLKIPDNETISTLKTLLYNETGCPPCQQDLRGFKESSYAFMLGDSSRLSELNLPKQNVLHLITPDPLPNTSEAVAAESTSNGDSVDFKLTIEDQTNDKIYNLNFRPTQTVFKVKLDTSTVTNIAVSKQIWSGWPKDISDELSLSQIGIPRAHYLTLKQNDTTTAASSSKSGEPKSMPDIDATMSEADSDDEYEDANDMEEEFFISSNDSSSASGKGRILPLIPDDYGDESLAGIKFAEEFAIRYGSPHPSFFPGNLTDAIKESCLQPAKERKMLAVYLHHDNSVLTNVFCTQALCAESIVQFLNSNFVCFGWDLTHNSNKLRAANMITREFGSVAASTVKNLHIERFPILALVYRLRGTTEIFQMIHGNVSLDELMSQLLSAHETYASQLSVEIREDEERAARDAVKREQDLAFEMSLQADREKQALREREEAERKEQEKLEEAIRRSEEEARLADEREKERKRKAIEERLPKEPPQDLKETSRLRIRAPNGTNLERRFESNLPLRVLLDYLVSKGFPQEEYKVLSSWPRRDLTTVDANKTLKELNLYPQETLTLEEK